MGYEIDFLAVERGEKSGDAIAFRIGNLRGRRDEQFVGVIDGGYTEDGVKLVKHIQQYYGTDIVDLVVSSHPDDDHSQGLAAVVEHMDVRLLWMHQPWNHADRIRRMFTDGRLTTRGVSDKFTRSLESAKAVERLALQKGIPIVEPFTGEPAAAGRRVYVIGPSRVYYEELLCDFDCAPAGARAVSLRSMVTTAGTAMVEAVKRKLEEKWDIETLGDDCSTSAENNSSTVLFVDAGEECWLLTGDAGAPALTQAMDVVDGARVDRSKIKFFQVPHHGSHHSVGPTILNRMLGPRLPAGSAMSRTAFVSSAKSAPKHPSRKVVNAYKRRGIEVHATEGDAKVRWSEHPERASYGPSTPLPFYSEVED